MNERTRRIPVIFVTAKAGDEDEAQGLGLGAVDYITKPVSPAIVLARVRTARAEQSHQRLEDLSETRPVSFEAGLSIHFPGAAGRANRQQPQEAHRVLSDIVGFANQTEDMRRRTSPSS
jgi:DNA-binding response OmpR family regulator